MIKKYFKSFFFPGLLILAEAVIFLLNCYPNSYLLGWDNIMPEFNIKLNLMRALSSIWQEYRGLGLADGMAHAANLLHTIYIWILSLFLPQNLLRYIFIHLTHLAGGLGLYFLLNKLIGSKKTAFVGALFYMLNLFTIQMYYAPLEAFATHFAALPIIALAVINAISSFTRKNLLILFFASFLLSPQGFVPTVFAATILMVISLLFAGPVSPFPQISLKKLRFGGPPGSTPANPSDLPQKKNVFSRLIEYAKKNLHNVLHLTGGKNKKNSVNMAKLSVSSDSNVAGGRARGDPNKPHPRQSAGEDLFGNARGQASLQLKKALVTLTIFLCANAFWLLPYLFSAPHTAQTVANTRINQFSSSELYARNQSRGHLSDILLLKGFMLDTQEISVFGDNVSQLLMQSWVKNINTPYYLMIMIAINLIFLIGLAHIIGDRRKIFYPFALTLLLALIMLANSTPILSSINNLFRQFLPILAEAFRIPFTKFSTLYIFSFSIIFSWGIYYLSGLLKNKKDIFLVAATIAILFVNRPAFEGFFTSPLLRVGLPNEYLSLFDYFKKIPPDKRIALLPAHTFWNWQYRSWGQRGSDFLWYGLPQPILMRPFDPWSKYNEQFYNELSYAISGENQKLFSSVLQKYDISYLLLDQYILSTNSSKPINYRRIERFLKSSKIVTPVKTLGQIQIYKVKNQKNAISYTGEQNVTRVYPGFDYDISDVIWLQNNNYIVDSQNPQMSYPFAGLANTRPIDKNRSFQIKSDDDKFQVTNSKSYEINAGSNITLEIPSLLTHEYLIPARFQIDKQNLKIEIIYPKFIFNNVQIELEGEIILFPLKQVFEPEEILLTESDQKINPDGVGYLTNNSINTIQLKKGDDIEFLNIDLTDVDAGFFPISLNTNKIRPLTAVVEKLDSIYAHENLVKNKYYTISDPVYNSIVDKCKNAAADVYYDADQKNITLTCQCATCGISTFIENLPHRQSYAVEVNAQRISGLPLNFYIDNVAEKRSELQTVIKENGKSTIFLGPSQNVLSGYSLHFNLNSPGAAISQSMINDYSIYPFPLMTLKNIRFVSENATSEQYDRSSPLSSSKTGTFLYKTEIPNNKGYVILSQAYDTEWKAYIKPNNELRIMNYATKLLPFIFGREIKNHLLVNNWANGWEVPTSPRLRGASNNQQSTINNQQLTINNIVIIFWPQYLQFAGFATSGIALFLLFLARRPSKPKKIV